VTTAASTSTGGLRRELGRWDLTAIGVNQVVGGAIFLAPALLAAQLGAWSWIGILLGGVLALVIALNFAEAGSRFDGTGGPYLYTREAFGRFTGFEVGWMMWVTRVTSWSSVLNGLADALGYYWPGLRTGMGRTAVLGAVVGTIAVVNVRGIRQSAFVVNLLTIGKLTPLAIFIALGLPHVAPAALAVRAAPAWSNLAPAALYLIFTYGGYETVPVPAGEARDPRRAVPFAMVATILVVAAVFTVVQVVAIGTLPALGASRTPLADAAAGFLGGWGALLMTIGAAVSISGNNMGAALSGSRTLYALAEQRDLAAVFGHVHRRFRTPDVAILFTSAATFALAWSSSFAALAAVSAIARLMLYVGTCASVLVLRRQGRAPFTTPFGPVLPVAGLVLSLAILYGASAEQLRVGAAFLLAGGALFFLARGRGAR